MLSVLRTELATSRRLRRLNWIASIAFTLGGLLFALGAWLSQVGSAGGQEISTVYLIGGVFFSTGAYASLLGAINAPAPDQQRSPLRGGLALVVV